MASHVVIENAKRFIVTAVLALAAVTVGGGWPAMAADCGANGAPAEDSVSVSLSCDAPGHAASDEAASAHGASSPSYLRYEWRTPCRKLGVDCAAAEACVAPDARVWQLWGLAADDRAWHYIASECISGTPTAAQLQLHQVAPGMVLTAIKQFGLPNLAGHRQPEGKTLVNFDTNFYVTPQPFTRTITLLGRSVDVEATPTQYTWLHGDGTSTATTGPGAPYPDLTVTYAYQHAGMVAPSVQVTYAARFRVEGGAWQQIPETVTVDGPVSSLQVVEGTGVLSGDYR
jgi:hypothetical protein